MQERVDKLANSVDDNEQPEEVPEESIEKNE